MKKAQTFYAAGFIAILSIYSTDHAGASSMPPGAFLKQPAPSVAALVNQLRRDPATCIRYSRLYNMSPEMVRTAFAAMRLERLPQDRIFKVHYIHPGERIGYKLRRLKRGTEVYAMADGTPILARVCGNPLVKGAALPRAVLGASHTAPKLIGPENVPDFDATEAVPGSLNPALDMPDMLRSVQPASDFVEVPSVPVPAILPTPVVPAGALGPAAVAHVGGFAGGAGLFALPLAALGILAASGSGGGGGGGVVGGGAGTPPAVIPPVFVGPTQGNVTPTPEPGSLTLMAGASIASCAVLRRRIRSRRQAA